MVEPAFPATGLSVYQIEPIRDHRWAAFVESHPRASVFHSPEWLEALRRTYDYEPVALTTAAPGEALRNGIVFCRVRSWITGRRLVSLPFSDHCDPLVRTDKELEGLVCGLDVEPDAAKWGYAEIRSVNGHAPNADWLVRTESYCLHRLDLRPDLDALFHAFHKDCVQRKIRRAEREKLSYEDGRSEQILDKFYSLLLLTRYRQRLPVQPLSWYRNLIDCMGQRLNIRVASKDGRPIAAIVTLRHKSTLMYKYGASDRRYSSLGGTQLLLWHAIEKAKREGLLVLDMGRSTLDNCGLINFKKRWGAVEHELTYLRYVLNRPHKPDTGMRMRFARRLSEVVPGGVLVTAGRALYRHFGCL